MLEKPFISQTKVYIFLNFTISLFFSLCLILFVPFDGIVDRENYLRVASTAGSILDFNFYSGFLYFISNEPLWIFINYFLSIFLDPYSVVIVIISFASFFSLSSVLSSKSFSVIFVLLIFLSPQVLKNYVIHLRQGLAISFFLLGYFSSKKWFKYFMFFLCPLVHSSFTFFILFYILLFFFKKNRISVYFQLFLLFFLFYIVSYYIEFISLYLNARQAVQYEFIGADSSGLAFIFWLLILLIFLLEGKMFAKKYSFTFCTLIFYLTTYFVLPFSARIFESTLVIVFLTGLDLTSFRKQLFLLLAFANILISYLILYSIPFLGWST